MDIVFLNSGGKDSLATAIKLRKKDGYRIVSIYLHLGKESDAAGAAMAKRVADKYCDEHHECKIEGLVPRMNPEGYMGIPFQARFVHNYATSWAWGRGIYAVASGERYFGAMPATQDTFDAITSFRPVVYEFPVAKFSDDEIFEVIKDEPLWHDTVACNEYPPCGSCKKCAPKKEWEARYGSGAA